MLTRKARDRAPKPSHVRALDAALEQLKNETRTGAVAEPPAANSISDPGTRASRLRERRARFIRRRRSSAALTTLVVIGLASATVVGSAAIANTNTNPPANSVQAFGPAPQLGSEAGVALRAGVVGIAGDPSGPGYWLVGGDGGVFAFGHAAFFGSTGDDHLNAPIVDIAPTGDGRGYWLVGADGGVFAFGDAEYHGSTAAMTLTAPIVAIVPTKNAGGYWLVGADGGVFAFGNARFHGSAQGLQLASPIVGADATVDGHGYWLVGADGGTFAYGDAKFHGSTPDLTNPAVGIAAAAKGNGYWVAHRDGSVTGFGAPSVGNPATVDLIGEHPFTVAIAASGRGGYWLAQGEIDPVSSIANDPFLACTRAHESDVAGGYGAVSSGGTYRGAYQFDRSTWNSAAHLAGRDDLVGVDPAAAAPGDQDLVAIALYHARGTQPWGGRCSGLS